MRTAHLVAIALCIACTCVWAQDAVQPASPTVADPSATNDVPVVSAEPEAAAPVLESTPEESAEQTPAAADSATPEAPAETQPAAGAGNVESTVPTSPPKPAPVKPSGPPTAQGASADAQVRVTLDPPEIPFHKQTRFTITVDAPAAADVKIPHMVGKFGGLEVYGQPNFTTTALDNDRKQVTETYVLDPILTGDYPISPVTVMVDGEAITVASPAVRVRELTPEEQEEAERFVSAAEPVDLPLPLWRRWEFWALVSIVAVAFAGLVWWFARRRQRVMRAAPSLPPWEVAYQRLRELDERKLPQAGRSNLYYVELSSILRHYIEDCFSVHAPEQTTPEFLAEASNKHVFSEEQQRLLASFLRHCDRVKFARYEPSVDEMDRSFAEVLRFVDETKPKPEQTTEERVA